MPVEVDWPVFDRKPVYADELVLIAKSTVSPGGAVAVEAANEETFASTC